MPKAGYLEEIVEIGNQRDILVIFDEIQAGFYRTGPLFSFEHSNAVPDIITMSKGLGGIGMPIAVTIFRKELDTWEKGTHAGTFRGNQMSIAAGASAIKFVKDNNVEQHVEALGKEIMERLEKIREKSRFIGDVRGLGLFIGIEYVKDKTSKEPFPEIVGELRKELYRNGLLVEAGGHYSNVLRFLPPLITTREIASNALDIFERVHDQLEKRLG